MIYRFAEFELDADAFTLRREEPDKTWTAVPTEPLIFDLIHFFARNPGEVLSRDALIDGVWKGRIVSDATLSSAVKAARRALGDSGEAQRLVQTVRSRGFLFAAEVSRSEVGDRSLRGAQAALGPASTSSLAIGPLRPIGVTPELGAIVDALAANLATLLTLVPLLQVSLEEAATGSAALQFRGDLRVIDDECHANIQLIDNSDGHLLWGRIFRQTLGDDAAAGLLQQVAPRLEPQLIRAIDREAHDGASVDARTLLIKATGVLSLKGWSRRSFEESAALLRGALAQNANMALAHAQLALILALGARFGLLAGELAEADVLAHADQALQLDDLDSNIAGSVGCALADIGKLRRARPLLKRAIDLNPNNAQAWAAMGALHLLERDFDTAVQALEKGLSISPMDPRRAVWRGFLAVVRLFNGDVDRAISEAQRAIEEDHRNHMPHLALAAAHLSAGDPARARTSLGDAREIRPELSRRELDLFIGEALAEKLLALDVGHSPSHSPWAGRGT